MPDLYGSGQAKARSSSKYSCISYQIERLGEMFNNPGVHEVCLSIQVTNNQLFDSWLFNFFITMPLLFKQINDQLSIIRTH